MRNTVCFYLLLFVLCACGRQRPDGVLGRSEMSVVLADYHIANQLVQELPSARRFETPAFFAGVWKKHHITEKTFQKSMEWYASNPSELNLVYMRVNKILEQQSSSAEIKTDENNIIRERRTNLLPMPKGDTVDVWHSVCPVASLRLSDLPADRSRQYVITPDSTFQSTDKLTLSFEPRFIGKGRGLAVVMSNSVIGLHDTTVVRAKIFSNKTNKPIAITLSALQGQTSVRQIWAYVYFIPDTVVSTRSSLFIDNIRLIRERAKTKTTNKTIKKTIKK